MGTYDELEYFHYSSVDTPWSNLDSICQSTQSTLARISGHELMEGCYFHWCVQLQQLNLSALVTM